MTREEAARWLAKRLVNYWDARQDNSEVERALLALTAQPAGATPPRYDEVYLKGTAALDRDDLCATAAASDQPLTVAGEIDWAAALAENQHNFNTHAIVTAATRNLKVVRVPTREEMIDAISSAVSKALGGGVDRYAAQVAADAILALIEVEK